MTEIILCECGKPMDVVSQNYMYAKYDKNGDVVFAICVHNVTVIDKREIREGCSENSIL